jgi:hypothetical protein
VKACSVDLHLGLRDKSSLGLTGEGVDDICQVYGVVGTELKLLSTFVRSTISEKSGLNKGSASKAAA